MSLPRIFLADESAGGWQSSAAATGAIGAVDMQSFSTHSAPPSSPPASSAPPVSSSLPTAIGGRRVHAIVPAARMRTLTVAVPPAASHKLASVVRFALEDQLAGDVDQQHVVIAAQRADNVLVHVIDRRWLIDALDRLAKLRANVVRVVGEGDLAPRAADALGTWIWRGDGGFLIEKSGKVTVLDHSPDALPSGLLLAIDRADARNAAHPQRIVVRGPAGLAARGEIWSRATGVQFVFAPEWSWRDAPDAAFEAAATLLTPALHASGAGAGAPRPRGPRWMRLAIGWVVAALLLHAGATTAAWATLKWRVAAIERDTERMIRAAAPELAADASASGPAWRARYAAFRHRLGKAAPEDALPMVADAAAGLRDIAPGAVRVINFEAGQLTIDVERSAAAAIASALPRWSAAGLSVLQAETPAGIRIRLGRE